MENFGPRKYLTTAFPFKIFVFIYSFKNKTNKDKNPALTYFFMFFSVFSITAD